MGELQVLPRCDVLLEGGLVRSLGPTGSVQAGPSATVIDAHGRVVMPAFVDCHTHACWAGNRLDEWDRKLRGATYQEILASGGGIMSTVRAVRATGEAELTERLAGRLNEVFWRGGSAVVEVKSGYGLSTREELKMLRAIAGADGRWPGRVVATALLGHAIDESDSDFVGRTIRETLPAVHAEFPGIAVDVFLEKGAWSLKESRQLLDAAKALGHPVRLHADQFTSLGGVGLGVELSAASVDHLEVTTPEDVARLASSPTVGVALPVCGMHLDGRYANLRGLIDSGGAAAIATNCNPGSAPSGSMALAVALGVRHCGLSVAEAITACTVNAAAVLGLADCGVIDVGMRSEVLLLRHTDERMLAYELGGEPGAIILG